MAFDPPFAPLTLSHNDRHNTGVELIVQKRWADAIFNFRGALAIEPTFTLAREHLAFALENSGALEKALHEYRIALPDSERPARILRRMAGIHTQFGRIAKAVELLERARTLSPAAADILSDLGHCLCSLGEVPDALDIFRTATVVDPSCLAAWSRMLLTTLYDPSLSAREVFGLHLKAGSAIVSSCPEAPPIRPGHPSSVDRIRIGYLSPDFCGHSVTTQVEPILRHHDRARFGVTCFSDTRRKDATTFRLQSYDLHWHETASLSDEALAELIRSQEIDILVDLAGHTGEGRLRVLASGAAPVQISAFGYPSTTGLKMVDYRIADSFTDPPGLADEYHTEKLLRMDPCFFCYQPPPGDMEIMGQTSSRTNRFVFCSFNALPKISNHVVEVWSAILTEIPDAALLLKALEFAEPQARGRLHAKFEARGISRERIGILPPMADRGLHLALYNSADLALDTFPYSGTITSCEALWMGVPVLSLPGQTHVTRVTGSILQTIGIPECMATSTDDYIAIAARAARRGKRTDNPRKALRETMRKSPLMDYTAYVRKLEQLYQAILR